MDYCEFNFLFDDNCFGIIVWLGLNIYSFVCLLIKLNVFKGEIHMDCRVATISTSYYTITTNQCFGKKLSGCLKKISDNI